MSRLRSSTDLLHLESWWMTPVIGVVVGYVALYAMQLTTAWSLYLLVGITVALLFPIIAKMAGGAERLLLVGMVMALQFELGFNPISSDLAAYKPAGLVGLHISLILLLAFALCFVRGLRILGGQKIRFNVHPPLVRAAALFFATGVLSMVNTPNKRFSVFGLWEILSLTLIAVAAGNWASTRDGLRLIRATLLVALLTQSLLILAENLFGVNLSMQAGVTGEGSWESARFAGTLIVPSVSATFVVIGLLFTMGRLFSVDASRHRGGLVALFGLGFFVLLISLTRSAWIAFGIGSTGLGWYLLRNGTLTTRDVRMIIGIAIVAALCAWPALSGRLSEQHTNDAEVRWNLVLIALAMIKTHPILGVGLNNATTVVRDYAAMAGLGNVWVFIVHNQFLLVAAETGLIGLAAFIWLFEIGIKCSYRAMKSADVLIRDTAAVVFWCLLSLVWALNLDHVASTMTYVFVWFLIGTATGLHFLVNAETEPVES